MIQKDGWKLKRRFCKPFMEELRRVLLKPIIMHWIWILFLRIATELHLKRLIVGGFEGVYEFGKLFRNEGMDRTHNPEFTTVELYVAYKDYLWMMRMTEQVLEQVAIAANGTTKAQFGDIELDFAGPYPRLSITDAIHQYTGLNVDASR